jgi:hypothetical protein
LLECQAQDAKRRFVLSAYPSDDTFAMYEYEDRCVFNGGLGLGLGGFEDVGVGVFMWINI